MCKEFFLIEKNLTFLVHDVEGEGELFAKFFLGQRPFLDLYINFDHSGLSHIHADIPETLKIAGKCGYSLQLFPPLYGKVLGAHV